MRSPGSRSARAAAPARLVCTPPPAGPLACSRDGLQRAAPVAPARAARRLARPVGAECQPQNLNRRERGAARHTTQSPVRMRTQARVWLRATTRRAAPQTRARGRCRRAARANANANAARNHMHPGPSSGPRAARAWQRAPCGAASQARSRARDAARPGRACTGGRAVHV